MKQKVYRITLYWRVYSQNELQRVTSIDVEFELVGEIICNLPLWDLERITTEEVQEESTWKRD